MCVRERECVCERESACVCVRECVCERECVCACVRVCACERGAALVWDDVGVCAITSIESTRRTIMRRDFELSAVFYTVVIDGCRLTD